MRGRKPKHTARQEAHLADLYRAGDTSTADLAELFGVGRSTVYRAIERAGGRSTPPNAPPERRPAVEAPDATPTPSMFLPSTRPS
ncbi:MAG: helix-turn-helix domain-containing protein [Janthinobacterium lividum]